MNTEDFDEAIREKLESLNQSYTETEIDKVYSHVRHKRKFPFKGSAGSWLLYSLSAAAFTVATVWTVSHFNTNYQAGVRNAKFSKQVNRSTTDSTLTDAVPTDTSSLKPTGINIADVASYQKDILSASTHDNTPEVNEEEGTPAGSKTVNTANPNPISTGAGRESVINLGRNKAQPPAIPAESTANTATNNKPETENSDSIPTQENQIIPEHPEIVAPLLTVVHSDQKAVEQKADLAKQPDTSMQQTTAETEILQETKTKKSVVRVGADFQLSNQSLGAEVTGEWQFSTNFGIETGLKFNRYQTEHYSDKDDLFRHKRPDFNHRIDDHFSGMDHPREISIDNSLLQIPVSFRYYVPLKKYYSVYFSLGTDIDIYLSQKLIFTHNVDSGRMEHDNFKTQGNVEPFNNIVISAGLEKQWKSWSIQLQPFIKPKLKEVFYKPKEFEFGVGIGVKYGFGK